MDEPQKDEPYNPEPGSTLHDIKKTEQLGEIRDEETEKERLDSSMYEKMSSAVQQLKELVMDWTHTDTE